MGIDERIREILRLESAPSVFDPHVLDDGTGSISAWTHPPSARPLIDALVALGPSALPELRMARALGPATVDAIILRIEGEEARREALEAVRSLGSAQEIAEAVRGIRGRWSSTMPFSQHAILSMPSSACRPQHAERAGA